MKGSSKLKLSSENWCKSLLEVKEHPGPTGGVSDVVRHSCVELAGLSFQPFPFLLILSVMKQASLLDSIA